MKPTDYYHNSMRFITVAVTVIASLLFSVAAVFAQTPTPTPNPTVRPVLIYSTGGRPKVDDGRIHYLDVSERLKARTIQSYNSAGITIRDATGDASVTIVDATRALLGRKTAPFFLKSASDLVVEASGNRRVGIEDYTPDYKLEIQGYSGTGYFGISNSSDGDVLGVDSSGRLLLGLSSTAWSWINLGLGSSSEVRNIGFGEFRAGLGGGSAGGPLVLSIGSNIYHTATSLARPDSAKGTAYIRTYVSTTTDSHIEFGSTRTAGGLREVARIGSDPSTNDPEMGLNDTDPDYRLEIVGSTNNGYFGITNTSDGDVLAVDSSGHVGVNTNSPNLFLDVNGTFGIRMSSPATLASTENDYDPGNYSVLRLVAATGGTTLTGMSGGYDGRIVIMINVGTSGDDIVIARESTSSSASNRFTGPSLWSRTLDDGDTSIFIYDATTQRWRDLGGFF